MKEGEQLELGTPSDCKNPRKITIEVTVDHDSKDWHWIYKTMLDQSFVNGMKMKSIRNGFITDDVDEALMWAQNEMARQERE